MARRLAIACVLAGGASAGGGASLAQAKPRMLKGPYLQELAPSSITVMWQLDQAKPARVIAEGPGGPIEVAVAPARLGEAALRGLAPSSRYRYRVIVEDRAWEGQFATAPPAGQDAPLTFAVLGDTRYGAEPHRKIVERIAREAPAFVLGTGDMVDDGSRQDQWQQFFDIEGPLLRDHVFFPAVGNHDRQGRGRTTDTYRAYFSVPESGGDTERYYAFSYATSRFLVLDSNIHSFALTDQTAWLERELGAARQDKAVRHIFVVMHHPPFSISLHGGSKELRERWTPLYERYGVSAVFSGHDHVYTRAEHNGVRYFVTGGGGAPLYPRRPRPSAADAAAVQKFERSYHFLRVSVTGRRIEVTGVRTDGTAIEATAWTEAAPAPPAAPAAPAAPAPAAPPRQPITVEVGAPAVPGAQARAPIPGERPERPSSLWIGLAAVGGLLGAAVVVVRTLRR